MVKDDETVIQQVFHSTQCSPLKLHPANNKKFREFNDLVNMTANELKDWLQQSSSEEAGWRKDDGSGESVGHESGRKIIAILEKNPKKDPSKYDDEDLQHMRKVVSYNKRHLAQEGKAKQDPDSRSARSLKNWGHDPQKT
ncbi:hypothetical protein D0864_09902 [Hortaea werneckii]|uniref:Uncharacterized protein n=1 Tax=Hortaea werneckii TaxID=91943 RepID=A0A3M7EEI7_HORWE|nr:hypothetical protein KC317_g14232 [Hortaea werneckii]KAI7681918.1 hypothetical protein KC322_g14098 [Hortaea werneckii]RMY75048.1 hypothetical protein D0864_09902 [Hortaea werneckii]